ncbi:unnamed protein product [marine sediment metagenome]|uniref:Uncharacterized protein n=1 Tax=marine sediment metagenome TaxID=412755 RepID=X1NFR0_9ZZZZ
MDNLASLLEIAKKLDKPSLALLLAFAVFLKAGQDAEGQDSGNPDKNPGQ